MGARYMVTGSLATVAYGEPRLTVDVDLVIDLAADDVVELRRAFGGADYYCPSEDLILEEISRPAGGHINLVHPASGLKADLYFKGREPLHDWAFERRHRLRIAELGVWFAPPEYVILRKLQFFKEGGSPKHLRDIRSVLAVRSAELDVAAIAHLGSGLGVTDLWERVLVSVKQDFGSGVP